MIHEGPLLSHFTSILIPFYSQVTVVEHMDPSGSTTTFLGVADEGDSHEYMGSFMLWRYDVEEDSFSLLQVRISMF